MASIEYCAKLLAYLYAPVTTRTPNISVLPEDYESLKRSKPLDLGFQNDGWCAGPLQGRGIVADTGDVQLGPYVAAKLLYFAVENDNNPEVEEFLVEKLGADPRNEDLHSKETALRKTIVKKLCRYVKNPQEMNGDFSTIGHILLALNDDDHLDYEDLIRVLRLAYHNIDLFSP
jgi:hypothetical protein